MLQLAEVVGIGPLAINDIEHCTNCDIGLIEGGVCNSENVHVLREFEKLQDSGAVGALRY